MYSQNKEDEIIANYFGGFKGTLLDAGANDGVTFSNSRDLLLKGWRGFLFEPSSVYEELEAIYENNDYVKTIPRGIGMYNSTDVSFFESGAHVIGGKDRALVSSFLKGELNRWHGVEFNRTTCNIVAFKDWFESECVSTLDFITIDIEGMDWELLQAIDLEQVGCKCLCIEWNSIPQQKALFTNYCAKFGLKPIHANAENIIFAI